MLFLLLLLPFTTMAQEGGNPFLVKGDSTVKWVSLPTKNLHLLQEHGRYSNYSYVIRHDSIYHRVFKNYSRDSLPAINFQTSELVLRTTCTQCLATCPDNRPCHRNACRYTSIWFVRRIISKNG